MTREEKAALKRYLRFKSSQPFINAILTIGLIAALASVAIVLLVVLPPKDETIGKLSLGLDQVNASLKTVCRKTDTVDKETLPSPVKDDCSRAEKDQKPPIVDTPAASVPAPLAVDSATLFSAVRTVVSNELAANPPPRGEKGEAPSPEEILRDVQNVYNANKPADAKTPTTEELLTLIRGVYLANPPAPGANGVDGKDATQEMADAAMENYCKAPGDRCKGEKGDSIKGDAGKNGEDGRGIIGHIYEVRDGTCMEVDTYTKEPVEVVFPVNPLLCAG